MKFKYFNDDLTCKVNNPVRKLDQDIHKLVNDFCKKNRDISMLELVLVQDWIGNASSLPFLAERFRKKRKGK